MSKKTPTPGPCTLNWKRSEVAREIAVEQAGEALTEERGARDELVASLKEIHAVTIAGKDEAIERSELRYSRLMRFLIFENVMILIMFGVAVGVVQSGSLDVMGFGSVEVGSSPAEGAAGSPTAPAPTPAADQP